MEPTALKGVIFDMDGTLTIPGDLSFAELRSRFGIPKAADIMQCLASKPEPLRSEATRAVEELERQARERMNLQPGAKELLAHVVGSGLKTALLTRNSRKSVDALVDRLGTGFDVVISRDDMPELPSKPDPAPVRHICGLWSCSPRQVVVVGDHLPDLECGNGAGSRTCLLLNHSNGQYSPFATHVLRSLLELIPLINQWK